MSCSALPLFCFLAYECVCASVSLCVSTSENKEDPNLNAGGAARNSGLRCLTKTVQISCDIEKGRLLYVPANVQTEIRDPPGE